MSHLDFLRQRGMKIPGSNLLRDFCCRCDTPIRVIDTSHPNWCETCNPKRPPAGKSGPLDEDAGSYQSIAKRALEDM
jgi:hypothetical protein